MIKEFKKDLKEQNVLFIARSMDVGGAEHIILQICKVLLPLVKSITVCSNGGINVAELYKLKIEHKEIPDIERKTPNIILKTSRILEHVVRDKDITIIHTHHRMASFYAEMLGLYKNCKVINTCHNSYYDKKKLTYFAYRHAHLIACGNMVKKNLTNFFKISSDRITVIPNMIPPFKETVVPDVFIQKLKKDGMFLVANVGRLSEQKGFSYYIEAIPLVLKEHPDTRFLIIGCGEDEEKLKNMAKNLKEQLFFMGYRRDVQNLMKQVDLVVLSSLWEGLPLIPLEAFSAGKTIVATGVDGTLEIVKNFKNGLLVQPKNAVDLAKKIVWIIEHPNERQRMEQNAQALFRESFSFDHFASAYAEYYKNILA